jgi:hypothetical protein
MRFLKEMVYPKGGDALNLYMVCMVGSGICTVPELIDEFIENFKVRNAYLEV